MNADHKHYTMQSSTKTEKNSKPFIRLCSLKSCRKPTNPRERHFLPIHKYRRARWLKSLNLKESDITTKRFCICSEHFNDSDYWPSKFGNPNTKRKTYLKILAVPNLNTSDNGIHIITTKKSLISPRYELNLFN